MSDPVLIRAPELDALTKSERVVIIDTRDLMKPSAHGPVFKSPSDILAECRTAGIAPNDTVHLYCFKGARVEHLRALKEAGFSDVRMCFGSWNEWSREPGLPIESGFPSN